MKKQSQNDYYCPIVQLCKTNDKNKFEALTQHVNRKTQTILHVKLFWCGAPATLVMGSSFV
jgi:hypothetical protein